MRPELRASVWTVATEGFPTPSGAASDDAIRVRGTSGRMDYSRVFDVGSMRIGGGLSRAWLRWPRLQGVSERTSTRSLAFADLSAGARRTGDASAISAMLRAHMSAGRGDGGPSFGRGIISVGVRTSSMVAPPIDLTATYGRVSARASSFERFLIGGLPSTLVDPSLVAQRIAMPALPAATATGDRVLAWRAASALGPLAPFYWTGSARDGGGRFDRWHRVIGLELILDQSVLPVLGTPSARFTAGVARSVDAPFARQTRAYATVVLGP
jgi:hypothetical protein